jgi:DNA-binding NtrC family response regulator
MSKILVVDDEVGIRELLSEILGEEGHEVTVAENATVARNLFMKNRPELVLLDIWMPDIDGVSLLKEWASSGLMSMPVIMMSGHGTIDTAGGSNSYWRVFVFREACSAAKTPINGVSCS